MRNKQKNVSTPILEEVYGIFVLTYLSNSSNSFTKKVLKFLQNTFLKENTLSLKQKRTNCVYHNVNFYLFIYSVKLFDINFVFIFYRGQQVYQFFQNCHVFTPFTCLPSLNLTLTLTLTLPYLSKCTLPN